MIPRFRPSLGFFEFLSAFLPCGSSEIVKFEQEFSSKMGQEYAVAFPYGRTALVAILSSFGFKNKKIICPSYTCVVVAHAIVKSGNIPIFVDCAEDDFNMSLDLVEDLIDKDTVAILATSIFGYPVNLDALNEIKKKFPYIKIIQDCAHSFSASYNGQDVQKNGDVAFFGLNVSKIITTVFGGIATTDNVEIYEELLKYRSNNVSKASFIKGLYQRFYLVAFFFAFTNTLYSIVNWLERKKFLSKLSDYYDENKIELPRDYLEMMTPFGARVGRIQLKKYDEIILRRRKNASYYEKALSDFSELKLPPIVSGATYSHYVPLLESISRDELMMATIENGLQIGWLIEYSIGEMTCYKSFESTDLTISKSYANKTVNLPLYVSNPEIVVKKLKRAINSIKNRG